MEKILVCPPTNFTVRYEINPWMQTSVTPDPPLVKSQWDNLCNRLIRAGAFLSYIEPSPECPDMVFTANAGLTMDKRVILSNFKYEQRKTEKQHFKNWFLKRNYQVIEIPESVHFEGEGDALFLNDTLFIGYGFRTDIESHRIISNVFNVECISCELVDPRFYHLDTCFFPTDTQVVYYPQAFSSDSRQLIANKLMQIKKRNPRFKIYAVHERQALEFVCNSIDIEGSILCPSDSLPSQIPNKVNVCNMSEFMKSGGAVKCLTLRL